MHLALYTIFVISFKPIVLAKELQFLHDTISISIIILFDKSFCLIIDVNKISRYLSPLAIYLDF